MTGNKLRNGREFLIVIGVPPIRPMNCPLLLHAEPLASEVEQSIDCGGCYWTPAASTFDGDGRIWSLPQSFLRLTRCDKPNRHSYNKCWWLTMSFIQSIQQC